MLRTALNQHTDGQAQTDIDSEGERERETHTQEEREDRMMTEIRQCFVIR